MRSLTLQWCAACLALSAGAFSAQALANEVYHPVGGEKGASFNPQHLSATSREQVNAQLSAAQRQAAWNHVSRGAPWPAAGNGSARSRAQVQAELASAMQDPAWDRVSRLGAPWPAGVPQVNVARGQ